MISPAAAYMGSRIIAGALEYTTVITHRPDLKDGIDQYLTEKYRQDLITA